MKDGDFQYTLARPARRVPAARRERPRDALRRQLLGRPGQRGDADRGPTCRPVRARCSRARCSRAPTPARSSTCPSSAAESDEPLTSDIPTLILQGGLDHATPVAGGDAVAAGLSKVTNAVDPRRHPCAGPDPVRRADHRVLRRRPVRHPGHQLHRSGRAHEGGARPTVASRRRLGVHHRPAARRAWRRPHPATTATHSTSSCSAPTRRRDDDAAIEALLKTYEAVKPAGETVDGPDIAGLPSRHFVGTADGYAPGAGIDIFAFSDDATTYVDRRPLLRCDHPRDRFRGNELPALLQSVELGR